MKIHAARFNLLLPAALCVAVSSCSSPGPKGAKAKVQTTLRFHLEVNRDGTDKNSLVTIGRSVPFVVNTQNEAFLNEYQILEAAVVDDSLGGFGIRVQFNRRGSWLLDQYTTANKGKRVAIFCQFDQTARWLAAPILATRITNGTFSFTPDASREEADRIVLGLNEQGKEVKKDER